MSFRDSKAGQCHMGIDKTDDAKRRNKRPGIHYDLLKYIKSWMYHFPMQGIFSRWYMNSISEFPKTKVGSQCTLRMADSFSHWCECFLSQSQYAGIVAKVLYNEYFTRFSQIGVQTLYQKLLQLYQHYLKLNDYVQVVFIQKPMIFCNNSIPYWFNVYGHIGHENQTQSNESLSSVIKAIMMLFLEYKIQVTCHT